MVKPGLSGSEAVLGLKKLQWRIVKRPHTFFGLDRRSRDRQNRGEEWDSADRTCEHHGPLICQLMSKTDVSSVGCGIARTANTERLSGHNFQLARHLFPANSSLFKA